MIKWGSFLTVVADNPSYTVLVVHPDCKDVELSHGSCVRQRSANETAAWMIGQRGPYTVNSLVNGSVNGYSADIHNNNLIIKNITKNDDRNETDYQCAISIAEGSVTSLKYR